MEDLLKLGCPGNCVICGKLAVPTEVPPRVLNQKDLVTLVLKDLKDSISVVTD